MRTYLRSGITYRRTITYKDHRKIPRAGYIFASRTKASKGHLHYQAVWAAAKREAPKFAKFLAEQGKSVPPEVAKLKPHGRGATLITELMGEGMVTALSMKSPAMFPAPTRCT